MRIWGTARAAVAFAAAVLGASALASEHSHIALDQQAALLETELGQLESVGASQEEDPAAHRVKRMAQGEIQFALGDWLHTGILLADLVDDPEFRASRDYPRAVFLLAESLREQGACVAARARYDELLGLNAKSLHPQAIAGAMQCAVKEDRPDVMEPLVTAAERVFSGNPPPEVRYLAAKALYQRTDLDPAERRKKAQAALAQVEAPYQLQARYFEGVLLVEEGADGKAIEKFGECALAKGEGLSPEVAELCTLAVARLEASAGHTAPALDWYARIPRESPHFNEALYEIAWNYLKSQRYDEALETAEVIADLAPESPLAPEAKILEAQLFLKKKDGARATALYEDVVHTYAPVRDQIDALLKGHDDPVRYFNELIAHEGKSFDVTSILPPAAARWASGQEEVAGALDVVQALDASRRDARDASQLAERIELSLERGDGLDAFPYLERAYAASEAIENGAALLEGKVAATLASAQASLDPAAREELQKVLALQAESEKRLTTLPSSPEEADARRRHLRERLDKIDREAFQLTQAVDGLNAAITGSENWLQRYRAELTGGEEDRQKLTDELKEHRKTAESYSEETQRLRDEIVKARDAVAGSDAMREEAELRKEYLASVARERELVKAGHLTAPQQDALTRAEEYARRLGAVRESARAFGKKLKDEASRRASEVKKRLASERWALNEQLADLELVQGDAKDLVGRIAYRAFGQVRGQFYRLVLKADLGLVDVAWQEKLDEVEKIQKLSLEKGKELDRLDKVYGTVLKEVN